MKNSRLLSVVYVVLAIGASYFVVSTQISDSSFKFKLGLDLAGGTHLLYEADTQNVDPADLNDNLQALRDTIERRVNVFGVSEPLIQIEKSGALTGEQHSRLIIELPGVTDVDEAVRLIGETPLLEFKLLVIDDQDTSTTTVFSDESFIPTGLTGRYLKRTEVQFDPTLNTPSVSLVFDKEGSELFAEITKNNIGRVLAIFLDGEPISTPVIQSEIRGGQAEISGGFTVEEARELSRNLNYGALPLPIELVSTQSVGASLGASILAKGVKAGIVGVIISIIFMIIWYRAFGLIASFSLLVYIAFMLTIFKFVGVTLTAAGIAGFIMSIGLALDANVIIFERIKEERRKNRNDFHSAVKIGFERAWLSIRDGNVSTIIGAIILFWFGSSLIEGFALTLGLGVAVSMLTAIVITKAFAFAVSPKKLTKSGNIIFGAGLIVDDNKSN